MTTEPRQEAEQALFKLEDECRKFEQEQDSRLPEWHDRLVTALAAAIEAADREPEQWPGVTDTTAPFVTAAEAYEAVRERLRRALSALREDET